MAIVYKIFDKSYPLSSGIYGALRFKDSEKLAIVQANHLAIRQEMGAQHLLMLHHVYGTKIVDADNVIDFSYEPDADASIASKPGILLSVQTADCVPVLLACKKSKVVAAAHCSWHTSLNNILMLLVEAMRVKGASEIEAIIGPAIRQDSYEVDAQFRDKFLASERLAQAFFRKGNRDHHYQFDLPAFCKLKLNQLGIKEIMDTGEDTYSNPEKYCSYRRDRQQGITGNRTNILSTIMISND